MHRRVLLRAASLLALPGPGRAAPAPCFSLQAAPQERVLVRGRRGPGAVSLPAAGLRLLTAGTLCGWTMALLAFAAPASGAACEMLAVVGEAADGPRLLALELLRKHGPGGAHLTTHASLAPDGGRLLLARDAAAPGPRAPLWRRESWTDVLAAPRSSPLGGAAMRNDPVHPAPAGTWQRALAAERARLAAALRDSPQSVTDAMLARLALWPDLPAAG